MGHSGFGMRLVSEVARCVAIRLAFVMFGVVVAFALLELTLNLCSIALQSTRDGRYASYVVGTDTYRILAIGESTTEGIGANKSWPQQVEELLMARHPEKRFQVFNLGRAGINSSVIAREIPKWLKTYRPHLVIGMVGTNDKGNALVFSPPEFLPTPIARSRSYQLISRLLRVVGQKFGQRAEMVVAPAEALADVNEDVIDEKCREITHKVNSGIPLDLGNKISSPEGFQEIRSLLFQCMHSNYKYAGVAVFNAITVHAPTPGLYAEVAYITNFAMGDFTKSIEIISAGIEAFPSSATLYDTHARVLLMPNGQRSNEYEKLALESSLKALKLEQNEIKFFDTILTLVNGATHENCEIVRDLFEGLPKRLPDLYGAWQRAAQFFQRCGPEDEIEKAYKQSLQASSCTFQCWADYAFYLRNRQNIRDAKETLHTALRKFPTAILLHETLASIELELGNYSRALEIYEDMVEGGLLDNVGEFTPGLATRQQAISLLVNRNGVYSNDLMRGLLVWLGDEAPTMNFTAHYYKEILKQVRASGARLAAMQYPTLPLDNLREIFADSPDVILIENESNFNNALATRPYSDLFVDRFTATYGHCTDYGNSLIAMSVVKRLEESLIEVGRKDWTGR